MAANTLHIARAVTVSTDRTDTWADYADIAIPFSGTFHGRRIMDAVGRCAKVVGTGSYRGRVTACRRDGDRAIVTVRWCIGD